MKQFVQDIVWPKLENNDLMYCPITGDPIVDMQIYTKHRQFRIPGSSKAKNYKPLELPSREFIYKARIVDRPGTPDYTASDLGIEVKMKFQAACYGKYPKRD